MFRAYATLVLAAALATGCSATTGDDSMFIVNNSAAPTTGACSFTGQAGQSFTSSGLIDTATRAGYLFTPLVQSNIVAAQGQEAARTIEVLGANIDLAFVSSSDSTTVNLPSSHYSVLTSGSLPPGTTQNFSLEIIPATVIAAAKPMTATGTVTLDATVQMFGRLGGSKVSGRPFDYPVTVCNGCLITNAGPCGGMVAPASTNVCQPYQDAKVTCCTDMTTGKLDCP